MKKIKPTTLRYMIGHYLFAIPLSIIFILTGAYFFSIKFMGNEFGLGVIVAGIIITLIPLIHSVVYSRTTSIGFDDEKIVFESGILSHRTKKAPVHMITDSSLNRSLVQRITDAATLNISTSGSSGYEIVCEGLMNKEAKELHEQIYERIDKIQKK
ncbi:MAG: PH domain-containing protein [Candidatus Micrarchaeota archaeon]